MLFSVFYQNTSTVLDALRCWFCVSGFSLFQSFHDEMSFFPKIQNWQKWRRNWQKTNQIKLSHTSNFMNIPNHRLRFRIWILFFGRCVCYIRSFEHTLLTLFAEWLTIYCYRKKICQHLNILWISKGKRKRRKTKEWAKEQNVRKICTFLNGFLGDNCFFLLVFFSLLAPFYIFHANKKTKLKCMSSVYRFWSLLCLG